MAWTLASTFNSSARERRRGTVQSWRSGERTRYRNSHEEQGRGPGTGTFLRSKGEDQVQIESSGAGERIRYRNSHEEQGRGPGTGTVLRSKGEDQVHDRVLMSRGEDQVQEQFWGAGKRTRHRYSPEEQLGESVTGTVLISKEEDQIKEQSRGAGGRTIV